MKYEIEEGDSIQYYFVTRKDDEANVFTAVREHHANPDFTRIFVESQDIPLNEQEEISAAISKYIEKEKRTVQIEVNGGTVVDVRNLPEGCNYEVIDRDVMEEER